MRHPTQFLKPFLGIITILVLAETWRSQRVVHDFSTCVKWIFAHQPIIFTRDFAYVRGPLHLVEFRAARFLYVFRCQAADSASMAVEPHQARPVLSRVVGLLGPEELRRDF